MKNGECYKERGKYIIESRIEFPDPMFMTFDTPHGPNAKILKKWPKNQGKNYFSLILVFMGCNIWMGHQLFGVSQFKQMTQIVLKLSVDNVNVFFL